MKVSKNFYLQEFVPLSMYEEEGERAIGAIDERIIISAQTLRDELGSPLSINTWHSGGERYESGLRVEGMTHYSRLSQHTYGRAVDIVSNKYLAQELREHILRNPRKYPYITRLEDKVSWLHMDLKNTNFGHVIMFEPESRFNYELY